MENEKENSICGAKLLDPMFEDLERFNIMCRMVMADQWKMRELSYRNMKIKNLWEMLVSNTLEIDQALTDINYDLKIPNVEKIRFLVSIQKSAVDVSNYAMMIHRYAQVELDKITKTKCPDCNSTLEQKENDIRPSCRFCGYIASVEKKDTSQND